jgi:tetratricopeptide (TPR) repeat protein
LQADVYWEHQRLATLLQPVDARRAAFHWRQAQLSWTRHLDLNVNNEYRTHWYAVQVALADADVAMADGDIEGACSTLLRCIDISSASTSVVELFVSRLEADGETEWADRIFKAVADRFLHVLEKWPNSALHHNNLAWACARCNRLPTERMIHARRAVELEPDNTSYLDTLAEVLFLSGDTAEALQLAQRCVELNPFSDHYRQQVTRFQNAQLGEDR